MELGLGTVVDVGSRMMGMGKARLVVLTGVGTVLTIPDPRPGAIVCLTRDQVGP